MNEINFEECFYILARERVTEQAEYSVGTILPNPPLIKRSNIFQAVFISIKCRKGGLRIDDCYDFAEGTGCDPQKGKRKVED